MNQTVYKPHYDFSLRHFIQRHWSTSFVLLSLLLVNISTAQARTQHWSSLLHKVSNNSKTIISLKMQQIHSFNFMLDPAKWQLQNVQTFEDKERYEFSKTFKCITKICKASTVLAMTFVTYKYSEKVYSKNQVERRFPVSKWRDAFEKDTAIKARYHQRISPSDRNNHLGHGYRYHTISMNSTPINGLIDLLFYSQSQTRLVISSPKTKQSILQTLLEEVEKTMTLQKLR